jgi:regulator of Ty1 transposition protein 103
MVSPMVSMAQQPSQIPQQQPLPLAQQQATINQQQQMSLNQQPQGPNFRPLRPHGMVYYGHPSHS